MSPVVMTAVMTGRFLATSEYQWPVATKGLARERAREAIFFFSGRRRFGFFCRKVDSRQRKEASDSCLSSALCFPCSFWVEGRAEVEELDLFEREREKEQAAVSANDEGKKEERKERGGAPKARRRSTLGNKRARARLLPSHRLLRPSRRALSGVLSCQSPL